MTSRKEHWESVYNTKNAAEVSWTQFDPRMSVALIQEVCRTGSVIDIGGGASHLAGALLDQGYKVAVLDISEAALRHARDRLGHRADQIRWIVADVTSNPELGEFDVWHDRASFHFLIDSGDRAEYVTLLTHTVRIGGHAVISTFALDGPERCSGLEVRRYDAQMLAQELGAAFSLVKSVPEIHYTPWGTPQSFQYSVFKRVQGESAPHT